MSALRVFLKDHGLNGWIVPTADPHLSEYVDEHYAFRKWLSGFTGSAGSLLVTQDAAALVTDSRYWVQAEQQLEGSGIELVKLNQGYAAGVCRLVCRTLDGQRLCRHQLRIDFRQKRQELRPSFCRETSSSLAGSCRRPKETIWEERPGTR